ncbi:MAG TPA: hypothetical protein ACHBX0_09225 [Arsenophonus sp.]
MGLHALGPEKYVDIQDSSQLAEKERSNRAGEDLTMRGQNISAPHAPLSRAIQRAELQEKVSNQQIARETNTVKLDELRQKKQADVQQKAPITKAYCQAITQGEVDTFNAALNSLNEIEMGLGLSNVVGINSASPTIPGTGGANFEARLDTFQAQIFLPMVANRKDMGALSDAEGKKLSDDVRPLSLKMSHRAFPLSYGKSKGNMKASPATLRNNSIIRNQLHSLRRNKRHSSKQASLHYGVING